MLIRSIRQLVAILGSLVFITFTLLVFRFYDGSSVALPYIAERWGDGDLVGGRTATPDFTSSQDSAQDALAKTSHGDDEFDLNVYGKPVHEVFSVSTKKGKYFPIVFGEYEALNPSIIPHPSQEDTWIIVAQQQRTSVANSVWFAELVCDAKFQKGKLTCIKSPLILPITATSGEYNTCTGNLGFLAFNVGPHDARVFYGPSNPYTIYGSQSAHNCFGQWIQDLRLLTDWGVVPTSPNDKANPFRRPTELQRPPPYGVVEKNWFVFWDNSGQLYAHYDISPKRVFAQLSADGSAGPDLAPITAKADEKCMARYMPQLAPSLESIHQATNSLSVTLCKRNDPACKPTDANTFIMTIFQHKTYYNYHSVYEPYVMLFKQSAPFAVHGISTKPIWIHGRGNAERPKQLSPTDTWDATEMFYVTSMSWKAHDQKYHGYIDDVIFLAFGIEDKRTAGIDVVVGEILDHLGLCSDAKGIVNPQMPDVNPSDVPDLSGLEADTAQQNGEAFGQDSNGDPLATALDNSM